MSTVTLEIPGSKTFEEPLMNDKDKLWLKGQITEAETRIGNLVSERVRAAVESFKPKGWKKAIAVLRELGPLVAIIGVFVAMLGITLGEVYQAISHVKEETEFRTNTKDRLTDIERDVRDIRSLLTKQSLANHATLPLPDFQTTLPELKSSIQLARKERVRVPSSVIDGLQHKFLKTSEEAPEFWSTVLEFISYRSFSMFAGGPWN